MRPAPLAAVAFLCRNYSYGLEALPHVADLVSAFIDCATPEFWSVERACERDDLRLIKRIAANEASDVDPYIKAFDCSKGLVVAVRNDNLDIVRWLCLEYCPWVIPMKGIDEAVKLGNMRMLEWIFAHVETARWTRKMAELAVDNAHLDVLQWVLTHLDRVDVDDVHLSLMRRAAMVGHVPMFKWLFNAPNRPGSPDVRPFNQGALRNALTCRHFEIAEYLINQDDSLGVNDFRLLGLFAKSGDLELVQRIENLQRTCEGIDWIDNAAIDGHLHIIQWAYTSFKNAMCIVHAMDYAATHAHFHVVQWLHENWNGGCTAQAMTGAASYGHLDIVQWLHDNRSEGCTMYAMDLAAANGHLDVVEWLHAHRPEGCTTRAMDQAAGNGHLDVVKWLHNNRTEGCTTWAMDSAASNGHLDVVQFLHENRSEGCTTNAMDNAAAANHFHVVKWLHENRSEGCTMRAIDRAGSLEVAKWLNGNRTEGCSALALVYAVQRDDFETLLFWQDMHPEWYTSKTAISAICGNNPEIFQWIYAKYPEQVDLDTVIERTRYEANEYTSALLEQLRAQ